MIRLDVYDVPTVIPIAGAPYRVYRPRDREALHAIHRDWWWMYLWPSSVLLAQDLPMLPTSSRVLEIGCGLGLVGAVASKLGLSVTCTDTTEETEWFSWYTARASGAQPPTWVLPSGVTGIFDYIVFADVMYSNFRSPTRLASFIDAHLSPNGEVWCVEPERDRIIAPCLTALSEMGIGVVERIEGIPAPPYDNECPPRELEPHHVKLRLRREDLA